MNRNIPALGQLLQVLQQVPYLASKNLYLVASHFLSMTDEQLQQFCQVLMVSKKNLIACPICFCWQELDQPCVFCTSSRRDNRVVCVIEMWFDVYAIEKTQSYMGGYHVLGGVISPLDGIGPENLNIDALVKRIQEKNVREIILALNQTPEGEATAAYIAKKLAGIPVEITCLARGLPVGSTLGIIDRVTLHKALEERRKF